MPGLDVAFTRGNRHGAKVNFVVLSPEQSLQLWKLPLAGRDRVALSSNALLPDSANPIRLKTLGGDAPQFAVFPELPGVRLGDRALRARTRGVLIEFALPKPGIPRERIQVLPIRSAFLHDANVPNAMDEAVWTDAAVWRLTVPAAWRQRDALMRIDFVGNVARLYAGGRLVADKSYNGQLSRLCRESSRRSNSNPNGRNQLHENPDEDVDTGH